MGDTELGVISNKLLQCCERLSQVKLNKMRYGKLRWFKTRKAKIKVWNYETKQVDNNRDKMIW